MELKHVLASLVATFALAGHAATIDWGLHTPVEMASRTVETGSFKDTIDFSLTAPASITSVTVSNNLPSWLTLSSGEVSLFARATSPAGTDTLLGHYTFDGTTGSTDHTFAATTAGDFSGAGQGHGQHRWPVCADLVRFGRA
ncbi:MAG: hypothetical protein QM749_09465 [Aquabacterium sp.]